LDSDYTLRIAGDDDLPSLLGLWTTVLHPDPSVFTSEYESCTPDRRICFIAEADGQVVSSVQLFVLPIRDERLHSIDIGAIANVATLPDYRLKGISTALLLQAIKRMGAMKCAWSYLFTGITPYYERLGWRVIHRLFPSTPIDARHLPEAPANILLQDQPDLKLLRKMSEGSIITPLSQIRTDLDWEFKIPSRMSERSLLVGDDCFAILREADGRAKLEEWGMPRPSIDRSYNLLLAAAHWAASRGLPKLAVSAPINAEARQALESLFPNIEDIDERDAMVRPISEEWPMSRLVSFFAQPESRFLRLDNF